MTDSKYILSLDLGTTGNRAILFDRQGDIVGQAYKELTQYYPHPGWLEHDATEIWQEVSHCIQQVVNEQKADPQEIAAIGLTVQRETCLLWDKTTGKPLHKAIVWQDRRTADRCDRLKAEGKAEMIEQTTGLVLDAYFSATKLGWLIDWVQENLPDTNWDNVMAGTIDTWALWNLTGRQVHATDVSNASRTMLMNLDTGDWDNNLLELFNIPRQIMPEIKPSLGMFGKSDRTLLNAEIPITAIFGDQQAALYAHGCDRPGLVKCTYGTGCFLVAQTGTSVTRSQNRLLSTVAWSTPEQTNYALEGAIFTTGASIQWLRDGLKLIGNAAETEALSNSVANTDGVYFVPALSGLGAPHWDMQARGAFLGITGGVKREHMVRAVLEAIAYQVKEVVDAVNKDSSSPVTLLKIDGGAAQNNFLTQFQADVLGVTLERPQVLDATAQGAAFGAGLAIGFYDNYQKLVSDRPVSEIKPGAGQQQAQDNFAMWSKAVARAKNWVE
ncbi:MAG: glycerol kinase GlpK [Cyanobacteria bacterium P01_C01_bin.72]